MAAAAINLDSTGPVQHQDSNLPPSSFSGAVNELLNAPTNGIAPEQYSGQGEDDAPRSPVRKPHRKTSSVRMNGHKRDREGSGSQLIVEKFQDRDGEHLTTIKQYRPNNRAETQVRRSDELVSGRRVGTKWERSQYVRTLTCFWTMFIDLLAQQTFRAAFGSTPAASSDFDSVGSHIVHRLFSDQFLPASSCPSHLATPNTISSIYPVLQRWNLRNTISPLETPSVFLRLVPICIILPCSPSSLCCSAAHKKVYFWIPSAWHNLSRRVRCLRYRSIRLFSTLSGDHKHPPDTRRQLPCSILPRLLPCHGVGQCVT